MAKPRARSASSSVSKKKSANAGHTKNQKAKQKQLQMKNSKLIQQLDSDLSSIVRESANAQPQQQQRQQQQQQPAPSNNKRLLRDLGALKEKDTEAMNEDRERQQKVDDDLLQQLKVMDEIKI